MEQDKTFKYDVFISYSRLDKTFATKLQTSLERSFKKLHRNFRRNKSQLITIRDQEDFDSNLDLPDYVKQQIASCRKSIVICSPNATKSSWVNEEIENYRVSHNGITYSSSNEGIIPILFKSDDDIKNSMPLALMSKNRIPLAIEFREKEFSSIKSYMNYFKKEGLIRIYAAILDLKYRDIVDRQIRFRRKLRIQLFSLISFLAIFF